MGQPDRIVTVTTLKDTPANAERFVRRTLDSGVDHLVVFLDAEQPRVRAALEAHPSVTVVRTDPDYWLGERPPAVVDRQVVNAGVAAAALAEVASVRWLFHIDGDEELSFDRDALAGVETDAVRFRTLEAVARRRWRRAQPELFKRVPSNEELHALSALGLIASPDVHALFRGHSRGKPGVRPGVDVRFRVHSVYRSRDPEVDTEIEETLPDDMHLLHHESWCLADFLGRWQDYRADRPRQRPFRDDELGAAFWLISRDKTIGDAERRKRLRHLFDRLVADDRRMLERFDLVVRIERRPVAPRPLPADDIASLEAALTRLAAAGKAPYRPAWLEEPEHAAVTA